jgi:alkylation response protein AidB-like acyl-CoA dehydrogenase
MDFNFTSEQQLLSDTVQRFVATEYAFETRRKIMRSSDGWSREVWAKLAEMGLLALQVPEEHGGMAPASTETLVTMAAFGRGMLVEPYLPSAILATGLLRELGSPAQKEELFPALVAGEKIAVPAHGEHDARYDLSRVTTTATREKDGFVLNGRKAVVLHAPAADLLVVSGRSAGEVDAEHGISLFLVDRGAPGVTLEPYPTLDGQRAADVVLEAVRVPRERLLGPEGGAFPALAAVWDVGVAALCADAVGALQALFDATVEYAKTRKQFGVPIGKFQALQHRMAEMLIHVEQARSMSYLAAMRCTDPDPLARRSAISAAKVLVGQACRRVSQEAIQIHGGIGMTDELNVSHYFKRLAVAELSLGDTEHHLESYARSLAAPAR